MSTERRSTSVATKTSNVRSGCICCDTADSRQAVSPGLTSLKIQPCDARTCVSHRSSSGRYLNRRSSDGRPDIENERSSTKVASSHPRSHCTPSCQTPRSASPSQQSRRQTERVFPSEEGHGQELGELYHQRRFLFFPPIEYSPIFTLVFVSTDISSVSGSSAASFLTALTFSKIASVCLVFFSGFPF